MSPNEETLTRARRGDHVAFAEIVREHQAMVFGIACHFVRNRELAEEISQEVFLELYQNLDAMKSLDHVKFWLRRVAGHRCIDSTRRRKMQPLVTLDDIPEPAALAASDDPILAATLRRYVGTLPEAARMVVIMRYQEDLAPSEIAEVLEMPVNTVKSHLQRSLAILREKLTRCLGGVSV
jgi:RNA polymerase sigma-70 factor (ECF subfamily)